jgi:hypothetical protein
MDHTQKPALRKRTETQRNPFERAEAEAAFMEQVGGAAAAGLFASGLYGIQRAATQVAEAAEEVVPLLVSADSPEVAQQLLSATSGFDYDDDI